MDMIKRKRIILLRSVEAKGKGEENKQLREGFTLYLKLNEEVRRKRVGWIIR